VRATPAHSWLGEQWSPATVVRVPIRRYLVNATSGTLFTGKDGKVACVGKVVWVCRETKSILRPGCVTVSSHAVKRRDAFSTPTTMRQLLASRLHRTRTNKQRRKRRRMKTARLFALTTDSGQSSQVLNLVYNLIIYFHSKHARTARGLNTHARSADF
jgi:hypothetical protein